MSFSDAIAVCHNLIRRSYETAFFVSEKKKITKNDHTPGKYRTYERAMKSTEYKNSSETDGNEVTKTKKKYKSPVVIIINIVIVIAVIEPNA